MFCVGREPSLLKAYQTKSNIAIGTNSVASRAVAGFSTRLGLGCLSLYFCVPKPSAESLNTSYLLSNTYHCNDIS